MNKNFTSVNSISLALIILFFLFVMPENYCYSQLANTEHKIRTIVIDPGHGGKDPGAVGKHSKEKDIALAISLKAGKYISDNLPDVKVLFTRTTDVFPALHERAKIANDNNADLFISVHVNSNPKSSPYGTSSHVLGLHRMEENFDVAKRENSVILLEDDYETRYENFDPTSPESYIMFSLMQDVYFDQSIQFGQMVQDQFRDRAKRYDRGVRQQGLLVLAQTSMPGVLIETGFISNPKEEKYLMSDQGQDYLASAIFRAFRDYKNYIEGSVQNPVSAEVKIENPKTTHLPTTSEEVQKESELNVSESSVDKQNKTIDTQKNTTYISDILFKVQILYSEKQIELSDSVFNDFNDVQEITIDGKYKYVVGSKKEYAEAVEYSKWGKKSSPGCFYCCSFRRKDYTFVSGFRFKV